VSPEREKLARGREDNMSEERKEGKRKPWEPSKWTYRHDGILYYIMTHPRCTDMQIAQALNYSPTWVNQVHNSTIFQQRPAQFREEIWRRVREKELQDPPPAPPRGA
jgi:hypothetical protein